MFIIFREGINLLKLKYTIFYKYKIYKVSLFLCPLSIPFSTNVKNLISSPPLEEQKFALWFEHFLNIWNLAEEAHYYTINEITFIGSTFICN